MGTLDHEILLVDDDFVELEFQSIILSEQFSGLKLNKANNFDQAVDIFRRNKNIRIVLLDMLLPGNQSGIDVFLKFKEIRNDFKCIAVTRYDSKFGFKCGKFGFDDFIRKPFNIEDFKSAIEFQIKSLNNNIKGKVFCIMPFLDTLYDTYLFGIKQTLNNLGFYCSRIDEEIFNDSIIEKIKDSILNADYIIADLSYSNPNVYYEIGYAHALNKKVILIASSVHDIKFDLQHMRTIIYNDKISELKERLDKEFQNK